MSDDEIDKAVKEAAEFEAQDKKRKEAIDARNEAESFVFQTEDALKQVGDQVDAADKSAVEADIAAVKSFLDAHKEAEAMTDADVAELKAAQEKLTQSAQKVFAKMYEQAQAAQGAAGAGPDMNAGEVALLGELLENDTMYRKLLVQEIEKRCIGFKCVKPCEDAAEGAVLMARQSVRSEE